MPVEGDAEDAGLGGAGEEVAVVRGQLRLPVGAGFIATVERHTYTFHKRFLACSQAREDHRQAALAAATRNRIILAVLINARAQTVRGPLDRHTPAYFSSVR